MMERRFSRSAEKLKREARIWHYCICIMSFVTNCCAVFLTLSSMGPKVQSVVPESWHLRPSVGATGQTALVMFCGILPLISTFLSSGNAHFAPFPKYAALIGAAAKTTQAIYEYRARVCDFRSTRTKGHILSNLRLKSRLTDSVAVTDGELPSLRASRSSSGGPLGSSAPLGKELHPHLGRASSSRAPSIPDVSETTHLEQRSGAKSSQQLDPSSEQKLTIGKLTGSDTDSKSSQQHGPSQRFIEVLSDIQNQVMAGDNKVGCLVEPKEEDWEWEVERKHQQFLERAKANKLAAKQAALRDTSRHKPRVHPRDGASKDLSHSPTGSSTLESWTSTDCSKSHGDFTKPQAESTDNFESVKDDLCSLLSAEHYVQFRILPALEELKSSTGLPMLTRIWTTCQTLLLLGTMTTGILGVLGILELIPIFLTAMSSLESVIAFEQLQLRLLTTNQALQTLQRLMIWWNGLSMVEQRKVYNKEHLISQTEAVINIEANIFGTSLLSSHPPHIADDADGGKEANERKQPGAK